MAPPIYPNNKYRQLAENHITLRQKMSLAVEQATDAIFNLPNGPSDTVEVTIRGMVIRYIYGDQIRFNETEYPSLNSNDRKKAYDRLDEFMTEVLKRYDAQYGL